MTEAQRLTSVEKILVSACLVGHRVRYDGKVLPVAEQTMRLWRREGRLVWVCPEVDAGMSIPRAPAEIAVGDGSAVLDGGSSVLARSGVDLSQQFLAGANIALELCKQHGIRFAILTEASPSCGSSVIHDGTFSGVKKRGEGVTTALLRRHGITVYNQFQVEALRDALGSR